MTLDQRVEEAEVKVDAELIDIARVLNLFPYSVNPEVSSVRRRSSGKVVMNHDVALEQVSSPHEDSLYPDNVSFNALERAAAAYAIRSGDVDDEREQPLVYGVLFFPERLSFTLDNENINNGDVRAGILMEPSDHDLVRTGRVLREFDNPMDYIDFVVSSGRVKMFSDLYREMSLRDSVGTRGKDGREFFLEERTYENGLMRRFYASLDSSNHL